MSEKELKYKELAIETLKMLSSREEQIKYKENVPNINIPGELLSWWLDDFFVDTETSPKYSKEKNENILNFKNCFSTAEWAALNEFNTFFNKRSDKLPEEMDINEFVENPMWKEIIIKAKETLKILEKET